MPSPLFPLFKRCLFTLAARRGDLAQVEDEGRETTSIPFKILGPRPKEPNFRKTNEPKEITS